MCCCNSLLHMYMIMSLQSTPEWTKALTNLTFLQLVGGWSHYLMALLFKLRLKTWTASNQISQMFTSTFLHVYMFEYVLFSCNSSCEHENNIICKVVVASSHLASPNHDSHPNGHPFAPGEKGMDPFWRTWFLETLQLGPEVQLQVVGCFMVSSYELLLFPVQSHTRTTSK